MLKKLETNDKGSENYGKICQAANVVVLSNGPPALFRWL